MKRLMGLMVVAGLLASASMAHAQSCAGFTDVAAASSFCPSVEWLKNRKITKGGTCPPGVNVYCPDDPVTRLQMAAFMNRMGTAMTPEILFVDQNPGGVTIQGGSYGFVCLTSPYTVVGFPRRMVARGLAWGIVTAPVSWWADIWYSTDGGATFGYITNYIPSQTATVGGQLTENTTFAQMDLAVGSTYIFAILIRESTDLPGGTGDFSDLACHLMVEIGNRNGTSSPYDATEAAPAAAPAATPAATPATGAGKFARNANAAPLPR